MPTTQPAGGWVPVYGQAATASSPGWQPHMNGQGGVVATEENKQALSLEKNDGSRAPKGA
ncbi:uncharacterized protein Z519_11522 [Cladophialophora bantiana CBS 173.52]|uniref:Uncharacterized protein n=1 Tax=Cladophialophora bantiana (strain ATCC 10958 / CBS 173.52 / CDC B-1940 / NIH 8579) TaxID=1442370 RepID=A0A0D2FML0_CLAB1|nr:uncharacterized protein Z519_11522 [Cladophialophora bantiana CBS 173.52]KIW87937.1 hypothetical protein Z519_11522 [Cladophialophora bantiana CBS 173.52]